MEMRDASEEEKTYIRKIIIVALWCVQMKPTNEQRIGDVGRQGGNLADALQAYTKFRGFINGGSYGQSNKDTIFFKQWHNDN